MDRPGSAGGGILAGLLCIKPRLAIVFPAVLRNEHHAKPLAWCLATVAVLALPPSSSDWASGGWSRGPQTPLA